MSGTRQELRLPPARWAAKVRADKRGPVLGFVGKDDKTHATNRTSPLQAGVSVLSKCLTQSRGRSTPTVPFIANPKHKLCLACVSALEDEIRRDE